MSLKEPKPGYKFCPGGEYGCGKEKPLEEFGDNKNNKSGKQSYCNHCQNKYHAQYYARNKDKRLEYQKEYYEQNKDKRSEYNKEYYEQNKDKRLECIKEWSSRPALFRTYIQQLKGVEEVMQDRDGLLICFCKYCARPFSPTNGQAHKRIKSIIGTTWGQNNLYCSDECKAECPTFKTKWYSRDQKVGTSREVPASFRKMVLEDREWICENCGSTEPGLHVHHILGVVEYPMFAADMCNAKAVCKDCHDIIHSKPGCTYPEYQCAGRDPEFCEATTL